MSNTMLQSSFDAYKFYREETGEYEMVQPEKWRWVAFYTDGTYLKQFDDQGYFHQLKEIDQSRMNIFRMGNIETRQTIDIDWHPSRKLIHFYRNLRLENDTIRMRLYVFGYETKLNGVNHNVLHVILPDDRIVVTEDVNNVKVR